MTTTKTTREQEELREAFRCIVSLAYARPIDNKMTCSVYRLEPFNKEWDLATVSGVAEAVRLYLQSWVIPTLEEHLGLNEALMREIMERQHNERSEARTKATAS